MTKNKSPMTLNRAAYGSPVEAWEAAWENYIFKLRRVDELKQKGRYGYQMRMPGKALYLAERRLSRLDPEFCQRVLGIRAEKEVDGE